MSRAFAQHFAITAARSVTIASFAVVAMMAVTVFSLANRAAAQKNPAEQISQLNREAVDNYNHLEFDGAREKLEKAEQLAHRYNVIGPAPARTQVTFGILEISQRNPQQGLERFVAALREDSAIQVDPLMANPEIEAVFARARQELVRRNRTLSAEPARVPGNIPHFPVHEQLVQVGVPVFLGVPENAPVEEIRIYYRGRNMSRFRRAVMEPMEGGFGFVVPCHVVVPPVLEYFLVAKDTEGKTRGYSGTSQQPVRVSVVNERSYPEPALPGHAPPSACDLQKCPPGSPGCLQLDAGQLGEPCDRDSDCRLGLLCEKNQCSPDEGQNNEQDFPKFYARAGLTTGFAYTTSSMYADDAPTGFSDTDVYLIEGSGACPDNGDGIVDYCVNLNAPGFVPTTALRITAGMYVFLRISVGVSIRYQFRAGEGPFSHTQYGVFTAYRLTKPRDEGLVLTTHVGTSIGQIQPQPPQAAGSKRPFIRSGLNGAQLGATVTYRFSRNLGAFVTPELQLQFPLFLPVIDVTFGVETSF